MKETLQDWKDSIECGDKCGPCIRDFMGDDTSSPNHCCNGDLNNPFIQCLWLDFEKVRNDMSLINSKLEKIKEFISLHRKELSLEQHLLSELDSLVSYLPKEISPLEPPKRLSLKNSFALFYADYKARLNS